LPWRPSLAALADPLLRGQLITGLIATATAIGAIVSGVIWRRIRRYAFALAVLLLALAFPRLGVLLVDAYPTSFFASPTEFAATAITHGARLFAANCTACHGADGHGDGSLAKALPLTPADLTAAHFWVHTEGDLYWFIARGFTAPDGTIAMPGFGDKLSNEAIWDLIDYLRAHNAGAAMRQTGRWPQPIRMPQFDARCADGRVIDMDDLRGRVVHVLALGDGQEMQSVVSSTDVTTILVTREGVQEPGDETCIATEPETWTALAILLGVSSDAMAGAEALVDPNGWLRAAWPPGTKIDAEHQRALKARIRDIVEHPVTISAATGHHH
jgi:mono/diheme cytochrome c family protein